MRIADVLGTQDLSLLTHLSPSDIEHLQSVGKEAQAARQEFILKDDQDAVWKHVQSLKDGRLDFVLDNGMPLTHILNNDSKILIRV